MVGMVGLIGEAMCISLGTTGLGSGGVAALGVPFVVWIDVAAEHAGDAIVHGALGLLLEDEVGMPVIEQLVLQAAERLDVFLLAGNACAVQKATAATGLGDVGDEFGEADEDVFEGGEHGLDGGFFGYRPRAARGDPAGPGGGVGGKAWVVLGQSGGVGG